MQQYSVKSKSKSFSTMLVSINSLLLLIGLSFLQLQAHVFFDEMAQCIYGIEAVRMCTSTHCDSANQCSTCTGITAMSSCVYGTMNVTFPSIALWL
jgi:hypothetical protein